MFKNVLNLSDKCEKRVLNKFESIKKCKEVCLNKPAMPNIETDDENACFVEMNPLAVLIHFLVE